MKRILLITLLLLTYTLGRAQGVNDTHPDVQIFAIDYQTGREYAANTDQAILFKDAFIDLVRNTYQSKQTLKMIPGRKTAVIKQIDPQKLNGYQLTWQTTILGQTRAVCTFYYNIDENNLYFFDQGAQNWVGVQISPENQYNLDNCRATCHFNSQQGVPDLSANGGQGLPDLSALPDTTGQGIDEEVTTNEAPPALPEYNQPECPADGYLWQPGYWAWSPVAGDYYWVPGVWVAPPSTGLYWTPGYWGFDGGIYRFHVGYWGREVGFYGGINYGYGYGGAGYYGGEWRSGHFAYNTAVVHVNTVIVRNTYVNTTVIHNNTVVNNRTSFNGQGGVAAKPTPAEQAAMHQQHIMPTKDQIVHQQAALGNKDQFAGANHGKPTFTAMAKVQPAALNKGNSPAVNPNNRNINRPQGNGNAPNKPGTTGFGNANRQHANNGQQNNNGTNGNTPYNGRQQPAINGQQNNGLNKDGRTPANNQQQPAANGLQNGSNKDNRTPASNNKPNNNAINPPNKNQNNGPQPANNGLQNNTRTNQGNKGSANKPGNGQHQDNKTKPPKLNKDGGV